VLTTAFLRIKTGAQTQTPTEEFATIFLVSLVFFGCMGRLVFVPAVTSSTAYTPHDNARSVIR
jgi:hypothetical protein